MPRSNINPQPPDSPRQLPSTDPAREQIAAGFSHAISQLKGGVPSLWVADETAWILSGAIPRLTRARLLSFCRKQGTDLALMAAQVLTDALGIEEAILQLAPEDAAEELVLVLDPLWPSAATRPQAPVKELKPIPQHPSLDKLRTLASQRATFRRLPRKQLADPRAVIREQSFIRDIGLACLDAQESGIGPDICKRVLESVDGLWHEDVLRAWMVTAKSGLAFADWPGQAPEGVEVPATTGN